MGSGFLLQAVVYLGAAVVCVPVAKRLALGSVLGYLIAGILIGPFVLGFVGAEGKDIMHFAEFGVVVMLFLVGLELEPSKFWGMRRQILGVGMFQVLLTAGLLFAVGLAIGFGWRAALAAGLALAMSSTAIVIQSLKEKGLMQSASGQSSFAVLLFQDIAVIPILAILPLLAVQTAGASGGHGTPLDAYPGWVQTLGVIGAVGAIVLAGRFVVVPCLRLVAKTRLRELFTASALFLVVGIAYLMQTVGLSPALGTFLAGVVLANSEFRHELESDLDPFKGLLLGLFFIAVGASINFRLIATQPGLIAAYVLGVLALKGLVLAGLGRFFGLGTDQNLLFAVGLSQVGEFAFVLFAFIGKLKILGAATIDLMMAVTALSMTATPLLMLFLEKALLPRIGTTRRPERAPDAIEEHNAVIIAGFSHFGSTVGRFLRANGVKATILDNDSDRVELLRKLGFKVYYGDATRIDLLESAGAAEAKILVTAIDLPVENYDLVETIQHRFPQLQLMVRAKNRMDAYEFMDLGVRDVYRESIDTSVRLGVDVLKKLGHRGYSATRAGQKFLKYDEAAMRELAGHRHDQKVYISTAREKIALQERLLQNDREHDPTASDHAWDSEHMREVISRRT